MVYLASALRSIFCTLVILISIVVWGLITIITCALFKKGNYLPTFFTTKWSQFVIWLTGMKVELSGLENIPDSSCLYTFNHSSLLDIPVLNAYLTNDMRFGAKSSLFNIPIFGHSLKAVDTIRVFRGDRDKVIKEYSKSLVRVKEKGISVILAAEGKRNETPPQLLPFKSGPFILAIQGQIPVVPVVLEDVHKILPRKKLFMPFGPWRRPVGMKILKPIPTKGYEFSDRHTLKQLTYDAMNAYVKNQD